MTQAKSGEGLGQNPHVLIFILFIFGPRPALWALLVKKLIAG